MISFIGYGLRLEISQKLKKEAWCFDMYIHSGYDIKTKAFELTPILIIDFWDIAIEFEILLKDR